MSKLFLSYARDDDEVFVKKLYENLTSAKSDDDKSFEVWWDRKSMPNRGLVFTKEIKEAIDSVDRLVLVWGPDAQESDYVKAEWRYALEICIPVVPIWRLGESRNLPKELENNDSPNFTKDSEFENSYEYLFRQLNEPVAKIASAVPSLPETYFEPTEKIKEVVNHLLIEKSKPTIITAQARRAGLYGMGGVGKSVLATATARNCDIRRSYPDGIFWIRIGQNLDIVTSRQSSLARDLGFPNEVFRDIDDGRSFLNHKLADKKVWLKCKKCGNGQVAR